MLIVLLNILPEQPVCKIEPEVIQLMGMKPTLIVLAAGMGSRYGGIKQIDAVGPDGEAILDYSVYDALRADFGRVVFVIRKDIETEFRRMVGSRFESFVDVSYVFQELDDVPGTFKPTQDRKKPWGTAHAVWVCRNVVAEPFAVINADDFYGSGSYRTLSRALSAETPDSIHYAMVGFVLRKTLSPNGSVSRAICEVDDHHTLTRIVEHKKLFPRGEAAVSVRPDGTEDVLTGDELVSMNMFGFTPSAFDFIEAGFTEFLDRAGNDPTSEYYIPDVVDTLIRTGSASMSVLRSEEQWFGVTYREDKPVVEQELLRRAAEGAYPRPLWA